MLVSFNGKTPDLYPGIGSRWEQDIGSNPIARTIRIKGEETVKEIIKIKFQKLLLKA